MPSNGIPTLLLKHATLQSDRDSGGSTKLTVGAYCNGMGSICMLISTKYHSNPWSLLFIYKFCNVRTDDGNK